MRKIIRLSGKQITILFLISCLVAFYQFFFKPFSASLHNIPCAEDAEQARNLCGFVISQVTFDGKSADDTNQPPIYWDPFRNSARLDVYGVTNIEKQDQVLMAVRTWQTTNQNMAKLQVRFYERENLKQFTNAEGGYSGADRLPEVLIRDSWIVLSNQQSDVLINLASPKH